MNLTQHPEYQKYLSDKEKTLAVQAQLTAWVEEHAEAGAALTTAVSQLAAMFQEYNRVMWQEFPFCQMCLGGCCVVGASEVTLIDAAALPVLGDPLPLLPAQTRHNERACIYLGVQGCTWPTNWRPLKCMTFFSLGSGDWQLDTSDERYGRLTQALQAVLDKYLPDILGENYETAGTHELADPLRFAASLSRQLAELLLPVEIRGDNGRAQAAPTDPAATALLAIAGLAEQILIDPPDSASQLLADLEQFEWVVTGRPAQTQEILAEINGRYAPRLHNHATYLQFSQHIQQYLHSTHHHLEDS